MPLVSILTPTYNQAKYLPKTLESVLGQTWADWEMIVIDDGSDDETPEVIKRYPDKRIKYIQLPHRGLSKLAESYNYGLDKAEGQLIAILEGDDLWPADKLELQVKEFINDEHVILVWGEGMVVDAEGQPVQRLKTIGTLRKRKDFTPARIFKMLLKVNVLAPTVTTMVRKEILREAGGFYQGENALYVDLPTWLMVMAKSEGKVRFLNECLGFWRNHSQQTTQLYGSEMVKQHLVTTTSMAENLPEAVLHKLNCKPSDFKRAERYLQGLLSYEQGKVSLRKSEFRKAGRSFLSVLCSNLRMGYKVKSFLGWGAALCRVNLSGK